MPSERAPGGAQRIEAEAGARERPGVAAVSFPLLDSITLRDPPQQDVSSSWPCDDGGRVDAPPSVAVW